MSIDLSAIQSIGRVNLAGSLSDGMALRQARDEMDRANALRGFMQANGAGLLAGNGNALAGYAALDPAGAMGLQSDLLAQQASRQSMSLAQAQERRAAEAHGLGLEADRLGMASTRQSMDLQSEQARRVAEEYARGRKAEELAAEAAELESDLRGAAAFHAQGDREGFERYLAEAGVAPGTVTFDNFPAQAARMGTVLDTWRSFAPPAPEMREVGDRLYSIQGGQATAVPGIAEPEMAPDAYERFRPVGGQIWDFGLPGSSEQPKLVGGGQEEVIYGPDGAPIVSRGPMGTSARFTEQQAKDTVFSTRARSALERLDSVGADVLTSRSDVVLDATPLGVGRGFQNPDFQVASQAGQEFLVALLRKDTGAAVTPSEERIYGSIYLPQPGDGPAVLAAKAEARIVAVNALESGMNADQIAAQGRALIRAAAEASGAPAPDGLGPGLREGANAAPAPATAAPAASGSGVPAGGWPIDNDPPPEGVPERTWRFLNSEEREQLRRARGG